MKNKNINGFLDGNGEGGINKITPNGKLARDTKKKMNRM